MISHTVYGCSTTVSYVYSTFYPGNSSLSQPTTFRTCVLTRGGGGRRPQRSTQIRNRAGRSPLISAGSRGGAVPPKPESGSNAIGRSGLSGGSPVFVEFFPLTAPL